MNELPKGWTFTTLDSVAHWGSGGTPSRKNPEFFNGKIPWIKTGELGDKYVRTAEEFLSEEAVKKSSAKVFPKGSVGIAMYGATIGKASIWGIDASTNQACAVAQCTPEIISNEFLYYFLLSEKRGFINAGKGGAQPNISQGILKDWPIALPPVNEQKRIVAKIEELFSELDSGIESLKTARAQLKVYRQAVLKHAFEGKLTAPWREKNKDKLESPEQLLKRIIPGGKKPQLVTEEERSKLLALPETWQYARLAEIATIGSGMSVSKDRKVNDAVEVPYLRVANVQRGKLSLEEIKTMRIEKARLPDLELKQWDVLFNEGGDRDKLGRGWIWESQITPCITQNHVFRATTVLGLDFHAKFISHWGNSFGQAYFDTEGKQTTNLASINKGVLSRFPIPFPPLHEQEEIIRILEEKFSIIENLESTIDAELQISEALRQSILKKAFSGQLVAQDAKDEPARALLERIRTEKSTVTKKPKTKRRAA